MTTRTLNVDARRLTQNRTQDFSVTKPSRGPRKGGHQSGGIQSSGTPLYSLTINVTGSHTLSGADAHRTRPVRHNTLSYIVCVLFCCLCAFGRCVVSVVRVSRLCRSWPVVYGTAAHHADSQSCSETTDTCSTRAVSVRARETWRGIGPVRSDLWAR